MEVFFKSLAPESLLQRFHLGFPRIPTALLRLLTSDNRTHVVFLAEAVDVAGGLSRVVGEARYVPYPDMASAELALVVAEDWRRMGVGTSLVRALAQHARLTRVRQFIGDVLPENVPARAFLRSLGAKYTVGTSHAYVVRMYIEM
jgi:acetyltransferase